MLPHIFAESTCDKKIGACYILSLLAVIAPYPSEDHGGALKIRSFDAGPSSKPKRLACVTFSKDFLLCNHPQDPGAPESAAQEPEP